MSYYNLFCKTRHMLFYVWTRYGYNFCIDVNLYDYSCILVKIVFCILKYLQWFDWGRSVKMYAATSFNKLFATNEWTTAAVFPHYDASFFKRSLIIRISLTRLFSVYKNTYKDLIEEGLWKWIQPPPLRDFLPNLKMNYCCGVCALWRVLL